MDSLADQEAQVMACLRANDATAAVDGLSTPQVRHARVANGHPDDMTSGDIGKVLAGLKERGLVKMTRHTSTGRPLKTFRLTVRGLAAMKQVTA